MGQGRTWMVAALLSTGWAGLLGADDYAPLTRVADYYGFPPPMRSEGRQTLRSTYSELVFSEGSRRLEYNGTVIMMQEGLQARDGSWGVTRTDFETVIDPLLRSRRALARTPARVVMLDPGHGGADGGAQSASGLLEKTVALDIARMVRERLTASGLQVHMTRYRDETLGLDARCRAAARRKADLFVSIHLNAASNGGASGFETFVLPSVGQRSTAAREGDAMRYPGNRHDAQNMLLGYFVHFGVQSRVEGVDRGLKRARFLVLRNAPCPAALVECGFLSNRGDARELGSAQHRARLADGIAHGILTYASRAAEAREAAAARVESDGDAAD